jgi:tape measure domain-containing protein
MAGPSASQTIAELRIGLGLEAENLQPALSSFSQLLTKIERVTKSLRRQQEIADASGKAMSKGAQAATRASERQAAALRSQGNAVQSAFKATQMFNQAVNKVGAKQKETEILTKRMNKALLDYSKFMKVARSSNERFLATAKFKATMVRNTASLVDLKKSMLGGSTMAGKLQERFRDLTSSAVLVMGPLGGVAARLIQLKQALAFGVSTAAFVLGVAAATVVVTKLGIAAVRTGIEIDRLNNRLQIVTGSVALASAQFNDLVELADRSGANLSGLADQFTRMRQAVKGTSLEGDKFETIFEGLTMASAKFQLDADQTIGTLKAFEQMISKGTVQAEELRGQLGDRLPGALPIAAKALGKTTQELDKLLKAGAVATEDFLPKFVDMLKKVLGIKEGERINTVVAALGRLQNAWFLFSKEVSESFGIMNSVRAILDTSAAALTSLAQHMDKIAASVAAVGAAFTAWKLAALIGLISGAGGLIASLKVLHTWLMKIAKVQAVLTALTATMAGGYVKIIAALGAGIGT